MISGDDDGIVVVEMKRIDVATYFRGPETLRPMELIHGAVREPPAPRYGHQSLVTHLGALMHQHVRELDIGQVCVSPVDVVLDEAAALVLQPDIIFISKERLSIIRERVFGPPDLVVEVLSAGTAHRDRTTKLGWYHRYGVKECWLVDRRSRSLELVDLGGRRPQHYTYVGNAIPQSSVLPSWNVPAEHAFS